MPYEPLHHKYRPQTFAELVGQGAIAQTLSNALHQQKIAPAYLFTGARGTGKTSSARILAKSLNCQKSNVPTDRPCGVCEVCRAIANGSALDVIEIDAASNTGVDNIRELIERAQFAPVQCRYKIYIIDEVHMLSVAAFNALLKTLEEPPDRVVFVLATTDPQKVLPTIISRCQRFNFQRIALEEMVAHLSAIASKESIPIEPEAIHLVAQLSQGGLRDAESLLDQLSLLQGNITLEKVWDLVGAVPERDLLALVRAIAQDDPSTVLDKARHLMDRGREPLVVLQNLASFYRDLLIAKTAPQRNDLVAITPTTWAEMTQFVQAFHLSWILEGQKHLRSSEVQVKTSSQPRLWLEVALLGLLPSAIVTITPDVNLPGRLPLGGTVKHPVTPQSVTPAIVAPSPITAPEAKVTAPPVTPAPQPKEAIAPPPEPKVATPPGSEPVVEAVAPHVEEPASVEDEPSNPTLQQIWQTVITHLRPPGTQALLSQQGFLLAFNGQEARIGIRSEQLFRMAKERLPNVEAAFEAAFQTRIKVVLEVATQASTPPPTPQTSVPPANLPPIAPPPPVQLTPPPAQPPVAPPPPIRSELPNPPAITPPPAISIDPPPEAIHPQPYQEEDEVTRAAKSFAQFFRGTVVDLDSTASDNTASSESDSNAASETSPAKPSDWNQASATVEADDEDDVPF